MKSYKQLLIFMAAIGVMVACFSATGTAEDKTWTYDGIEYRLPQPVQEIQLPAETPESHVVVSGDCLWAISATYLTDPFLWPLVWEENLDTITNPHLIYPGDVVKLPGGTVMATEAMPPAQTTDMPARTFTTESDDADEQEGDTTIMLGQSAFEAPEPEPFSVTTVSEIVSSGFISKDKIDGPEIMASENNTLDLAENDIIFFEGGLEEGYQTEGEYFIVRKKHKVKHPISNRTMGTMYHIMGEAKVLCVNNTITTAVISKSYSAILRGDFLIPREEIPVPLTFGSPEFDRCNPSTKKLPGTIIESFVGGSDVSDATILAEGNIAYVDVGSQDGVAPGDYFTVFKRDQFDPRLPRFVSGEVMVIKVQEATSVVVVTKSNTAIFLGDQIELTQ